MRQISFLIDVISESDRRVFVGGRVQGDPLQVGDRFTAAIPATECAAQGRPVLLAVRRILLYGRYLNQVGTGVSAELELEPLAPGTPVLGEALIADVPSTLPADVIVFGAGEFHVRPI